MSANNKAAVHHVVSTTSRETKMGLKAPGIMIFLLSIIAALAVVFAHSFSATIPMMNTEGHQFYGLLVAYIILVLGCIVPNL